MVNPTSDCKTFIDVHHIFEEIEKIHHPSGYLYSGLNSCRASLNEEFDEVQTIYNLSETHSPSLRMKTVLRYEKLLAEDSAPSLSRTRDDLAWKCSGYPKEENLRRMLSQLKEMPKEWTIVQLTPKYNPQEFFNEDIEAYYTNALHICYLSCGESDAQPFLVTVEAPKDPVNGKTIELNQEIMNILKENKQVLTSWGKRKAFKNTREKNEYLNKRQNIEDRFKGLIKDMQDLWLKEWRCLLMGKYCDDQFEKHIKTEIGHYFQTGDFGVDLTDKILTILCCLVKGCLCLKLNEIKRAIQFCYPNEDKSFIKNVGQFIRNLGNKVIMRDGNKKRHPVILVLHDSLDCFPWEMIDVIQDEPVSRVPSLHFVYCLFKEHQHNIVNGHKIIREYNKGTYIVNPDMDLKLMEIRMMNFFNYWTPNWIGTSGHQPGKDEFFELLTSSDIFSYNGHGSGSHLMSTDKVQRSHVKSVVLLFGCSSTKINRLDSQVEMFGPYHMYLIARCPCVVGMLWEVTDVDTDVLTTDFMSYWIPSEAPLHWKYVDKTKWKKAGSEKIDFVKATQAVDNDCLWEPELLRALSLAKKSLSYYATKAACVVRGLPVKIVRNTV